MSGRALRGSAVLLEVEVKETVFGDRSVEHLDA
jgi:hypothetical protein